MPHWNRNKDSESTSGPDFGHIWCPSLGKLCKAQNPQSIPDDPTSLRPSSTEPYPKNPTKPQAKLPRILLNGVGCLQKLQTSRHLVISIYDTLIFNHFTTTEIKRRSDWMNPPRDRQVCRRVIVGMFWPLLVIAGFICFQDFRFSLFGTALPGV